MPEEAAPATATVRVPGGRAMRLTIGVMGGATGVMSREVLDKAHELGRAIATNGCILVTGACPGLPQASACGAKQVGGLVVGISPGLSLDEHVNKYGSPTDFHDVLVFTGSGLMGREVVNIRSSDIVVIAGGRSGTLGELAIAYDDGKLIGVLTGTGGISDLVEQILAACAKDTGARVVYDTDPQRLVDELLRLYRTEHYRRPSCFCSDSSRAEGGAATGMERDPVCGMLLHPEAAAASRVVGDRRYVFCSLTCAERFDASRTAEVRMANPATLRFLGGVGTVTGSKCLLTVVHGEPRASQALVESLRWASSSNTARIRPRSEVVRK